MTNKINSDILNNETTHIINEHELNVKIPIGGKTVHVDPSHIDEKYRIYVDGSCSLKNNRGGIGVYNDTLNFNVSLCIDDLFEKKTNSITELYAVKHALTLISELNLPNPEQFTIHSDSKYVVDSLSKWIHNWKKNNWLRADKKPISHKDLIVDTYTLLCDLHIWTMLSRTCSSFHQKWFHASTSQKSRSCRIHLHQHRSSRFLQT